MPRFGGSASSTVRRERARWTLDAELVDSLGELGGRTVGLVGFGAVGKCLAPMLQGIGAHVIYTSRAEADGAPARFVALPALLSDADVVSLHVPLAQQTKAMIDDRAINSMKPGAVLVNTAREASSDYDALYRALAGGRLRGAGLDVFDSEPVNPAHPLFQLPNVFVTPHVAWFTSETLQRGLSIFLENCRSAPPRRTLLHRVVVKGGGLSDRHASLFGAKRILTHHTLSFALPEIVREASMMTAARVSFSVLSPSNSS